MQINAKQHILTVLLEDYFQVGAFDHLINSQNWTRFETRYVENTHKALDLLDDYNVKATFFVLGWIGEQSPELVREIAARGHEIASRGYNHCPVSKMTPAEFRADLLKTRDILERAANQKVVGHRAAEKLDYNRHLWTLDILANENFEYDASFLPTWKATRAVPQRRFAHEYRSKNDRTIWELPYSTQRLTNFLLPISGGNYFRQIPYTLVRQAVKRWHEQQKSPFVMYFHVWELDSEQPRINAANLYNRVRHYRKLDKIEWILKENFTRYDFVPANEYLDCGVRNADGEFENRAANAVQIPEVISAESKIQNPKSKISIVVPCFNEEKTLPYLSNTLKSLTEKLGDYDIELVFVDDCSTDETWRKLNEIFGRLKNRQILRHKMNKGVAAAIMTGLSAAKNEIVCSIDADCTYDPHELVNMIPLLGENAAIVTASPYHPRGGVRNVPQWRLGLSKVASGLYQRVLRRSDLHTFTSCFRVYRKSKIVNLHLRENGFLGVAEMLGKLILRGEEIIEHPAVLEVRLFGFSKMRTLRTIYGHLKLLNYLRKQKTVVRHSELRTSENALSDSVSAAIKK